MNKSREGLFHSFIRHFDQWAGFIQTNDIMQKLEPIRQKMNDVCGSKSVRTTRYYADILERACDNLPNRLWFGKWLIHSSGG